MTRPGGATRLHQHRLNIVAKVPRKWLVHGRHCDLGLGGLAISADGDGRLAIADHPGRYAGGLALDDLLIVATQLGDDRTADQRVRTEIGQAFRIDRSLFERRRVAVQDVQGLLVGIGIASRNA